MIIFEGPDLCGKTTLAKLVANTLCGAYYHFGVPDPRTDHIEEFCEALKKLPYNTVYDRGCLSAFAYNFKCIQNPARDITSAKKLWRGIEAMQDAKALLVYVRAEPWAIKKRYEEKGDEFVFLNEILVAQVNYDILWDSMSATPLKSPTKIIVRNHEDQTPDDCFFKNIELYREYLNA